MDEKALQARLAAFAAERGWDALQNPRNLAIAIAGEAGMLLDLFRWLTDAQSNRIESEYKREAAAEAIADLVLHTLRLADKLGVDVERAVAKKLAENEANYPLPVEASPVPAAVAMPAAPKVVEANALEARPAEAKEAEATQAEATQAEATQAEARPAAAIPEEARPSAVKPAETKPDPGDVEARVPEPPVPPPAEAPPTAPAEKPIPTWLDGILPSRGAPARRKQGAAPKSVPEPAAPPPEAPTAPDRPPAPRDPGPAVPSPAVPAARAEAPPVPEEEIEAAPPPDETPEPVPAPREPPQPERYAHLDTDAAKALAKSLAKRVDGARSDDPLLRELHDEVETLRRTLYSPTPKATWMGDSLKTIRALLEEATTHDVGEVIRARDYIGQIDRMLAP